MSSIGQILNTAKEALLTHQVAIGVTGTNVANVSTPGYSRQRAVIEAKGTMESIENDVQIGVEVTQIQRMFDQFIEARINDQSSMLSYSEARQDALSQIEAIFNESQQEGLSGVMDRFWKAWDDLSFNPTGEVERFAVVSSAENLAAVFRDYSTQLEDVQGEKALAWVRERNAESWRRIQIHKRFERVQRVEERVGRRRPVGAFA